MRFARPLMLVATALKLALAVVPADAQMFGTASTAEKTVKVGGAQMSPSKNIIENTVNSKVHTTLVAALRAAGLVEILEGPGPFTVFAPTNEAFDKLLPDTIETLMKPENKAALAKILTYHVVPGRMTAGNLKKMVKEGNGSAILKTLEGDRLTVTQEGDKLFISGEKSGVAEVLIPNVLQFNGVVHVLNSVVQPN